MADKTLSQVVGNSAGFISRFASKTIEINFGATGVIATLSPPAGQRVKLTSLASSGVTQTNLTTITVGGNAVIADALLAQANSPTVAGELLIGFGSTSQEPITGGIDEDLEMSTDVALSQGTLYAYQFGE